jgi:predicted DNA-binding protein with PD1-like motif
MSATLERGRLGRIAVIRLKPNQDLVEGVEAAAAAEGIRDAVVRTAVGSLVDAALGFGADKRVEVAGPGVEILTLGGRLVGGAADLRGTISDSSARVYGGRFLKGGNPICITLELVLQEWIAE